MAIVEINDVQLYYEMYGEGIPLVLIAGLASDSQSWQPVVRDLSAYCQVIIFDNRGAGRTSPQEGEVSIRKIADDCIALADYLGLASVNLLGHSMGGFVALDCAIRYPERIDKLILAATSSFNSKRNNALFSDWASSFESGLDLKLWFRNIFYWIFTARFFENEEALKEAIRFALEYPYPQSKIAFQNQVKSIEGFNCTEELSKITAKTLVIGAEEDLLFPVNVCDQLTQAIPGAAFSLINLAAHSIHMENPEAFVDTVFAFLLDRR
jgi:pimeloyl-ACP methyl ester carboxylesterase